MLRQWKSSDDFHCGPLAEVFFQAAALQGQTLELVLESLCRLDQDGCVRPRCHSMIS